ncbi:MAG: glycosyltransferase family 2 protein [Parvibaculum sp.]|uniref:glycosyltransferase n=1 Tax=Parvibaculum sp. TaxID=2024848 RepID=UPI0025F1713F|nr:glycosyltransferase family 2 protein [Parvibaculum sp.]MCE9649644.1 glycosyltransferase family 2 protein [Parvibaculum sp.]
MHTSLVPPSPFPPKCSIIIRAYNEAEHIGRLLHGLTLQDYPNLEIILVDSGSTDDTVFIAEAFGVKIVHIKTEEFSFGRALNIGCRHASGDVFVFVSAHVYPLHRSWLARLVAPFADPHVALSYGKQRGNHINKFSEHQIFAKWFPETSVSPQSSYFCNNANCAIRASAWKAHPYDETLTGLEDLAWAKETQRRGGLIAYVAEASVVHVHDETHERVRNRYRREAIAMRSIQPGMHFGLFDFLYLFVSNALFDGIAAARQRRLGRELVSLLLFRFNQFYGTWRGHRGSAGITADLRRRFYFPQSREERRMPSSEIDCDELIDYSSTQEQPADTASTPVERRARGLR